MYCEFSSLGKHLANYTILYSKVSREWFFIAIVHHKLWYRVNFEMLGKYCATGGARAV